MIIFQDTVTTETMPTFQTVYENTQPIAVTTWVYRRLLAEIAGSNPASHMDVCLLWMWCFVRYRSLCWTDHSTREVQPRVVCLSIMFQANIKKWLWFILILQNYTKYQKMTVVNFKSPNELTTWSKVLYRSCQSLCQTTHSLPFMKHGSSVLHEVWDSHSRNYQQYCLLICVILQSGRYVLKF
jgi:hypothetical protein